MRVFSGKLLQEVQGRYAKLADAGRAPVTNYDYGILTLAMIELLEEILSELKGGRDNGGKGRK